uniref:Uncharacterized protein n=1 Tax=Nymphaea colorata TaxID=210225 RepID=A0A5K0WL73_9MAGN
MKPSIVSSNRLGPTIWDIIAVNFVPVVTIDIVEIWIPKKRRDTHRFDMETVEEEEQRSLAALLPL